MSLRNLKLNKIVSRLICLLRKHCMILLNVLFQHLENKLLWGKLLSSMPQEATKCQALPGLKYPQVVLLQTLKQPFFI